MYNGNVQQNPQSVKSCVTKEFFISPWFSPTIFGPDANSILLRVHLCLVGEYSVLLLTEYQHDEKEHTAHF